MATQTKRGWIWTDRERETIQTWQPTLRNRYRKMHEQLERFRTSIPAFAEEASNTVQPFFTTTKELLSLDGRRSGKQYQPMSPEQAQSSLEQVQSCLRDWNAFGTRADVAQAIREANKEIGSQNRQVKSAIRSAAAQFREEIDSPEYVNQLDTQVNDIMGFASAMAYAGVLRTADNHAELERLILVKAINAALQFLPDRGKEIGSLLAGSPPPSLRAVLKHTLYLTIKHETLNRLDLAQRHPETLLLLPSASLFINFLGSSATAVARDLQQAGSDGIPFSEKDFRILDFDYSLAAHPD